MTDQTIEDFKVFFEGFFVLVALIIIANWLLALRRNRKQSEYWKWMNADRRDGQDFPKSDEDSFHD